MNFTDQIHDYIFNKEVSFKITCQAGNTTHLYSVLCLMYNPGLSLALTALKVLLL